MKHVLSKHGVLPIEVEQVCQGTHVSWETHSSRIMLVGHTNEGRAITVILAPKSDHTYYSVTARPSSKPERKIFNERKGGDKAA